MSGESIIYKVSFEAGFSVELWSETLEKGHFQIEMSVSTETAKWQVSHDIKEQEWLEKLEKYVIWRPQLTHCIILPAGAIFIDAFMWQAALFFLCRTMYRKKVSIFFSPLISIRL